MKLDLNVAHPKNYKLETRLERIDLDKEKDEDLKSGKGFYISEPADIKKSLVRSDSIYSEKFMKTLQDPDAYSDRYSCECKLMQGKNYEGEICPKCHTKVKFVGEDINITGWIPLNEDDKKDYMIIHPNLYKSLEKFIGKYTLESILQPSIDLDINGKPVTKYSSNIAKSQIKKKYKKTKVKIDDTFSGMGMMEFHNRFDEIMSYFKEKNKGKNEDYYVDIMKNKDKVFIHNIPVYSTGLRPFKVEGQRFTFEGTNPIFNMIAKLAGKIRDDSLSIYKMPKYRKILLWDTQEKYNELYDEVEKICAGKKGVIKNLIGGRCDFIARSVIVPGPGLKINQVTLPYHCLLELMQQTVVNILEKTYSISYNDAYMRYKQAQNVEDPRIKEILLNLIHTTIDPDDGSYGIPVLINRNPTIGYGSIKAMKCIDINDNWAMGLPLRVCSSFGADFDGDSLNIIYIPNHEFWHSANEIFNPRNAMMISRNDGTFNNESNIFKDMLINANALVYLSRNTYSKKQLDDIERVLHKYNK